MEVASSFEQWKEVLSRGVGLAQKAGVPTTTIDEVAKRVGSFLAENVDPANREQRLLKELWDKGTEQERQALASMIRKMVSDGEVH